MVLSASLGFPRMGKHRELKRVIEAYWKKQVTREDVFATASQIRSERWLMQQQFGIDLIPSNDFSLYDHVLDTAVMVGAIPERFHGEDGPVGLDTYFAMARGGDVHAMEMTKWFDTNYHYIVPEFVENQVFRLTSKKPVDEFREALHLGVKTVPVLIGPITFLLLGKAKGTQFDVLNLLPRVLPVYEELLVELEAAGAEWIQIDEPCLALDRTPEERTLYQEVYDVLAGRTSLRILLATYFEGLHENLQFALNLPVAALHLDLVRAPEQLAELWQCQLPTEKFLSLGIVDGRNVWKSDLAHSLDVLQVAVDRLGTERVIVAPSCSLIHVPWDLDTESSLEPELRDWLAFAKQKLEELDILRIALMEGPSTVAARLEANQGALQRRQASSRVHRAEVQERLARSQSSDSNRKSPFPIRKQIQQRRFNFPLFPTTTIGSFPQTDEVRQVRADFRKGLKGVEEYEAFLRAEIKRCVALQIDLGLDVLVHGEFERADMVEYFGEQMEGFIFTQNGWVQSYGTRCVKPPIIYGDVSRPQPMTVRWSEYAASLTDRRVKGMLTGPVTILQWSFVRDDQPRETTCRQIAFAIRDEVLDLEDAGIAIIQVDEPALREGLPLRRAQWDTYLQWAVACFKLASVGVQDETQIHTHMCYAEFHDIMGAIQAMDADVISIETSRSEMELLDAFHRFSYQNDIGPGVYDIHSPRVPTVDEMVLLLTKACEHLDPGQLWVNPDCGLKTRGARETVVALQGMVEAAQVLRAQTVDVCPKCQSSVTDSSQSL